MLVLLMGLVLAMAVLWIGTIMTVLSRSHKNHKPTPEDTSTHAKDLEEHVSEQAGR